MIRQTHEGLADDDRWLQCHLGRVRLHVQRAEEPKLAHDFAEQVRNRLVLRGKVFDLIHSVNTTSGSRGSCLNQPNVQSALAAPNKPRDSRFSYPSPHARRRLCRRICRLC